MDKFVTRAPSWKTKSYEPVNPVGRYSIGTRKATEKKSLSQPLSGSNNNNVSNNRGRLSMRDEKLLQLFQTTPDQPLVMAPNESPAAPHPRGGDSLDGHSLSNAGDENSITQPPSNYLGELSDYISVPQHGNRLSKQKQQHYRSRNASQSPSTGGRGVHFPDELQVECSSQSTAVATSPVRRLQWMNLPAASVELSLPCTDTSTPPKHNPALMARIQRDLNSPSATVRMRAIKAMKSPTKSAYTLFDVPHAEQSLISAEERLTPPPPPTIEELMSDIAVYVEVRTGEDNRSAGVKKVISALGARVNDKFLRDTTHVVFKDGLLSTYKKAKNWGIPVVSILWIEACKTERKICDPNDFPISNVDRYENPELYDKLKRHKSMQPDSECNKRVRAKPGTPKDATPKTADGTHKKTTTLIGSTPTSTNKKTDISHFFKRITSAKKTPKSAQNIAGKEVSTPPRAEAPAAGVNMVPESPATLLLNRYTPVTNVFIKTKIPELTSQQSTATAEQDQGIKDALLKSDVTEAPNPRAKPIKDQNDSVALSSPIRVTTRRRSSMLKSHIDATTVSIGEMSLSQTPNTSSVRRTTRRRSSVHVQTSMNVQCDVSTTTTLPKRSDLTTIAEKQITTTDEADDEVRKSAMISPNVALPRRTARRRTTYTCKTLDISEVSTTDHVSTVEKEQKSKGTSRRRTLCTTRKMEESVATAPLESDAEAVNTESTVTLVPNEPPITTEDYQLQPRATNAVARSTRLISDDESTLSTLINESAFTPTAEKVFSSTRLVTDALKLTTPTQQTLDSTSLLEQCVAAPIFNSERKPGRRRTLFDVSMDIIAQRLQNINQNSARRSIAPANAYSISAGCADSNGSTETNEAPTPQSLTTSNLASQEEESVKLGTLSKISALTDDVESHAATYVKKSDSNEGNVDVPAATPPVIKKKRKLFMPNDSLLLLTPPVAVATQSTSSSSTSIGSLATPDSKRRRKLPFSQPQLKSKLNCSQANSSSAASIVSTSINGEENGGNRPSRRSTMDFQMVQRTKTTLATVKRAIATPKTSAIEPPVGVDKGQPSVGSASALAAVVPAPKKKLPFLVYTNMHKEQIEVIRETIKTLGGFHLEYSISEATTHVVSLEPRRTLNLLRALARGLWILDYNWILASVRHGRWLSEEHYELRDFSRAVEICRAERQAFGSIYKCELFSGLGPFYISSRCGPISKDNLKELIVLCGGRIVDQRKRAKYILGDANRTFEEKVYITPFWILDSITQMQLQPLKKYSADILPATQPKASDLYASQPRVQKAMQQVRQELM